MSSRVSADADPASGTGGVPDSDEVTGSGVEVTGSGGGALACEAGALACEAGVEALACEAEDRGRRRRELWEAAAVVLPEVLIAALEDRAVCAGSSWKTGSSPWNRGTVRRDVGGGVVPCARDLRDDVGAGLDAGLDAPGRMHGVHGEHGVHGSHGEHGEHGDVTAARPLTAGRMHGEHGAVDFCRPPRGRGRVHCVAGGGGWTDSWPDDS